MTLGRSVVNVTQKARGRQPVRYEIEIIPMTACECMAGCIDAWGWDSFCSETMLRNELAGEIPEGYDKLLFAWERGSKLFVTDAEAVRPNRAVFWKQFLKQPATMYRNAGGFEKKVSYYAQGVIILCYQTLQCSNVLG